MSQDTAQPPAAPESKDAKSLVIKTHKKTGKRYYAVRFVPGWAIRTTYLGFLEDIDVKPPPFKHRVAYPALVESGKGVAIVDSPYVKVYPAFFLDGAVILAIFVMCFVTRSPEPLWLLLPAIPILLFSTWLSYIFWLTTAMVVKESSITFYKGFYAVLQETVQGADLNGVKYGPLGRHWITRVLSTRFDLWFIRANFGDAPPRRRFRRKSPADGMASETPLQRRQHDDSTQSLNRFVLRGIGNGGAVGKLINRLQSRWEDSLLQSQASEKKAADHLANIDGKLDPNLINKFGRAYVAVSNRDARLLRELIDINKELLPLMRTIAKACTPGEITAPIPILPKKPKSPPKNGTPD